MSHELIIYHHDDCFDHDTGPGHPESPARLHAILAALKASPRLDGARFSAPPLGSEEQVKLAHIPQHLELVKERLPQTGRGNLDADTVLSPGSLRAALRGVGAACQGIDDLYGGNGGARHVMCLTRPPGHHATRRLAMGFCLFNQIAIAALYARRNHTSGRIAVVDFDVHHGNGTQDILRGEEGIHYLSTHQSPHYPGTGAKSENEPGNISNFPLSAGFSGEDYQALFREQLVPLLEADKPDLLLVSAGFDAHVRDPLASLGLTEETYYWLGEQLAGLAARFCNGRMLSVLEGGYNLDVLGQSVEAYLAGSISEA